jgi:hypothetical protein
VMVILPSLACQCNAQDALKRTGRPLKEDSISLLDR